MTKIMMTTRKILKKRTVTKVQKENETRGVAEVEVENSIIHNV